MNGFVSTLMHYFSFLLNISSTWFMVGLIWLIQIVHYPLFKLVGKKWIPDISQRAQYDDYPPCGDCYDHWINQQYIAGCFSSKKCFNNNSDNRSNSGFHHLGFHCFSSNPSAQCSFKSIWIWSTQLTRPIKLDTNHCMEHEGIIITLHAPLVSNPTEYSSLKEFFVILQKRFCYVSSACFRSDNWSSGCSIPSERRT